MSSSDWVVIILMGMCSWPFRKDGRLVLKMLICSAFIIPLVSLQDLQQSIEEEEAANKIRDKN